MVVYKLNKSIAFPDPHKTDSHGILAVGGDLRPERLLLAYAHGIFPWYSEEEPIVWHCPAERAVVVPAKIRINKTMRKVLRRKPFEIRYDTAFSSVIQACASIDRPDLNGTWITPEMIQAYCRLHDLGYAHCVECWQNQQLVGGVYGVTMGGVFFGESMFSLAPNASKVALITLAQTLDSFGYRLFDCQVPNPFLTTLGVETIPRQTFLTMLAELVAIDPMQEWPD